MMDAVPALPFRRSIVGKLTLAGIVLVLVTTVLLALATLAHLRQQGQQALEASIDTDLAGLADIYASGGEAELVARMGDRLAFSDVDSQALYLLVRAPNERLAGNLGSWPALDASRSQMGVFTTDDGRRAIGRSTQLDPSLRLLVGRRTAALDAMLATLRLWFVAASFGAVVLALLAGLWWSRRLQSRLQAIERQHRLVERGEKLARGADLTGGDEIDLIADRTQRMLARQSDLVQAYRDVSEHTAHEVRTPLMHLDHRLHKLLEHTVDPRVQEGVARSRQDVRSIIRLLESLLDISATRAQHGDVSDMERIDLSQLVQDVHEIYVDSAEDAGYALTADIAPGVFFSANPMQLQRLLSNLLDNALKYCPPGSHIRIGLQPGPVLSVEDDGPGIPPAERERIFAKFCRVKGTGAGGHGLGLALAQAIALRHGLRLWLDDVARGSRFMISSAETPHPATTENAA